MRSRAVAVAVSLGIAVLAGACSDGADEASQMGRPDEPPVETTVPSSVVPLPEADGYFEGTCPITQDEVAAAIGLPMSQGDPTPQECRFEQDVDVDDGVLSVSFVVAWEPRGDSGSSSQETGSSTSQTNDSGHHRTRERFETEHWEGSVVVEYDWARRDAPDFEAGKALVEALAARIEEEPHG